MAHSLFSTKATTATFPLGSEDATGTTTYSSASPWLTSSNRCVIYTVIMLVNAAETLTIVDSSGNAIPGMTMIVGGTAAHPRVLFDFGPDGVRTPLGGFGAKVSTGVLEVTVVYDRI